MLAGGISRLFVFLAQVLAHHLRRVLAWDALGVTREYLQIIVHSCLDSSVCGMSKLNGISRRSSRGDGGTKPENESTADELVKIGRGRLDGCPDNDNEAANEDTPSSPKCVGDETAEGERGDLAEVVGYEDNARGRTRTVEAEGVLVRLHGIDGTHEGAVWTVVSVRGAWEMFGTHRSRSWWRRGIR